MVKVGARKAIESGRQGQNPRYICDAMKGESFPPLIFDGHVLQSRHERFDKPRGSLELAPAYRFFALDPYRRFIVPVPSDLNLFVQQSLSNFRPSSICL